MPLEGGVRKDNFMENKDSLAKKASYLRIAAAELAEGMKEGNFRSLYRGQGIEFSGVRDYIRGDDIRAIDWNVTARSRKPHIKVYEEERELTMMLMVDVSGSRMFGTTDLLKKNIITELAAVLAFSAAQTAARPSQQRSLPRSRRTASMQKAG